MPNHLAEETSPYLLQHKDNPVDWRPWGEEALTLARDTDRPLLVSIGYSACHWCHVMERESFEDPEIAALMNERFVPIKVDREERPDIDAICMEACQAMTGRGGWPLNAFLTPEQVPFYTGTYFPPEQRHGLPSWRMVLLAIADAWEKRREEIREQSAQIVHTLNATARIAPSQDPISAQLLVDAVDSLRQTYDRANGGWGGAPKFPQASTIELLLARGEREMSLDVLRAMARGGIYDQIGGGFARYAVDATWTVPHFEKMLYDNALLARAYLHGWQVSGEERMLEVCRETLDWALREMRGPEGGFCSALDADSEGVEGKFYVWRLDELREVLGAELAEPAIAYFGASERGNFEPGLNVLEARGERPERLPEIRCQLFGARSKRVRPGLDDKRLTSWNALMISALAETGAALEHPPYVEAAVACAAFVLEELRDDDGRLLRTWKDGRGRLGGYLEDHAFLLEALITLYEATFDPRWYHEAVALADSADRALHRPRTRWVLHHPQRSRASGGAAQGPRGLADPIGQLGGGVRAAATGPALRRGQVRALRPRGAAAALHARLPPPTGLRPPPARGRLLPDAGARGGDRGSRSGTAGTRGPRGLPAPSRPRRWAGRRGAAARGPLARGRPRGRLRVRALRLPGAGHHAGRAGGAAIGPAGSARAPRE